MNVGQLYILCGLKFNKDDFQQAFAALTALRVAASFLNFKGIADSLINMATEAAHAGTHILGLSAGLGMSTQSVQEWGYVAEQAGTNVDAFARGIGMFESNLRKVSQGGGSKDFKAAMAELGFSAADVKAGLDGPDGLNALLFRVSDHYTKIGNTAQRAGLNQTLFGRRNREMAQDLGKGSEALRTQIDHFREIGGVVSETNLDNLKKFNGAMNDIKVAFKGLTMQVVGELGPAFADMLKDVTAWIVANRDTIMDVLTTAFEVLSVVIKGIFLLVQALGWMIRGVINGDVGAILLFSALLGVVIALAGAITVMLLPSIVAMGVALWAALLPILPWAALAAAVIAGVILLFKNWDEIVEFLTEHWEILLAVLMPFIGLPILIIKNWSTIKEWFGSFFAWLLGVLAVVFAPFIAIPALLISHWDDFKTFVHDLIESIVDKARWAWGRLKYYLNPTNWLDGEDGERGFLGRGIDFLTGSASSVVSGGAARQPAVSGWQMGGAQAGSTGSDASGGAAGPTGGGKGGGARASSVNVAPTTVNIYGVKDAHEAAGKMAEVIDNVHRHAAAGLAGDID